MTTPPDRLSDLWLNRSTLSKSDIGELYQRIVALLRPIAARICNALPDSHEFYIQEFAIRQVLEVSPKAAEKFKFKSEVETQAFVRTGFKFFILDIRKSKSRSDSDVEHVDDADLENMLPEDQSARDILSVVETLAAKGISFEKANTSAIKFSAGLQHDERLFLFHHTCIDYDDKQAERDHGKAALPLSQFNRIFGVRNYYRKARSLGIIGKSGGYVEDFAKSKIGRWMTTCGLRIDADHWDEMRAMLIVLCGVIFDSIDGKPSS